MIKTNIILQGDCLEKLKELPDESINCCMTSPPYWALRDYQTEGIIWNAKEGCEHDWTEHVKKPSGGKGSIASNVGANKNDFANMRDHDVISNFCSKCNAWKGQLGLEPTFDLYISHLCDIMDEVKRVLRKDGTCWVNIGDTYGGSGTGQKDTGKHGYKPENMATMKDKPSSKLESKNLLNIPARFSIEMQNRGWILRNTIIWHKPNCMPSSVNDRFTVDFEYIFFFVKNKNYWFEQQFDSVSEETKQRYKYDFMKGKCAELGNTVGKKKLNKEGRNKRTVWTITTKPFKEAHFAVYPEELCETPIKSGCPEFVCNKCGKAREKIFGKKEYLGKEKEVSGKFKDSGVHSAGAREHYFSEQRKYYINQEEIALFIKENIKGKELELNIEFGNFTWTHWIRTDKSGASLPSPKQYRKLKEILLLSDIYDKEMLTIVKVLVDDGGDKEVFLSLSDCKCNAGFSGGIVLDPFFGAGTTGLVALKQNKKFIGIELNPKYIEIANKRLKPYLEQTLLTEQLL